MNIALDNLESRALDLLRTLIGNPGAKWTSPLQWQAIAQIYQRQEDIIVIAATGSGKTMIALLPTLLGKDNELGLIVLPLNSLITDYKRKLNKMGIVYDVFAPGKTHINAQAKFLLVSPDHAQSAKWTEFLVSLTDSHYISRLMFDESHVPVTSVNYRKVMLCLDQLRIVAMQIVLITATCPPPTEAYMMSLFGLDPASTVIFRGQTDRPELEYIHTPQMPNNDNTLLFVNNLIKTHAKEDSSRAMIFVPFLPTGESAAAYLKCDFYHSKTNTDKPGPNHHSDQVKHKEMMYNAWFEGHKPDGTAIKTIVATSALSAGNDYPSVRLIIHLSTPFEMMTYVQEVSRGGRDGYPAKCILIPTRISKPFDEEASGPDHKGKKEMHNYVTGKVDCFRYAITGYCDGVGVYCYNDEKRQQCSLCRNRDPTQPKKKDQPSISSANSTSMILKRKAYSGDSESLFDALSKTAKSRKTQHQQLDLDYSNTLFLNLGIFGHSCAYCIMHHPSNTGHTITVCGKFKPLWKQYKEWKSSIRYPKTFPNISCYYCHVPKIGNTHPTYGDAKNCPYGDVIPVVAYSVFINSVLRKNASTHFNTTWGNLQSYTNWLISVPSDRNLTWISAIFLWYVKVTFNL